MSIKAFMHVHHLTVRGLAREIGMSKSTLSYQLRQPVSSWRYVLIKAIAKVVNSTPFQVIKDLSHK